MLKLNTNSPNNISLRYLVKQQSNIDNLARAQQVKSAQTLWDSKNSTKAGKTAFANIKQTLIGMCVSTELCNYCEHNEATDVEHIYPKSFFPERTFNWLNYLLACKICNTNYKVDQFDIFMPAQSTTAVKLQRKQLPNSTDAAFIDPRIEDPMHYLFLDIKGKTFYLIPHPSLTDQRDIVKATRTLTILQIDKRASLVNARKDAFNYYQDRLERYKQVRNATNWSDLERLIQDPDCLDKSKTFEAEQQSMMTGLKQGILKYLHPTVWREMQRQYHTLNKVKSLFEDVPEALTWV